MGGEMVTANQVRTAENEAGGTVMAVAVVTELAIAVVLVVATEGVALSETISTLKEGVASHFDQ